MLFAVLMVFADANFPGADPSVWEGERVHVDRAFSYFQQIGAVEAARRLRADVARWSLVETPEAYKQMMSRSMNHDPARIAAHDQEMAGIHQRSFRAAQLLDPTADFDAEFPGRPL